MELSCTLEERISKKNKPYKVIVIRVTDDYEMLVFPDKAQLALIEQNASQY